MLFNRKQSKHSARGRGWGLLEVAVSLAIVSIVMISLMEIIADNASANRTKATADRLVIIVDAAKKYVRANYNQLLASAGPGAPIVIPIGRTVSGGAQPPSPPGLPTLQSAGFVPESYVDVNSYGQSHALLVRKPDPNVLEVLITSHGGLPITDGDLGRIASRVGAEGGFMMANPPTGTPGTIFGAYGGWRMLAADWANGFANPTPGHVMAAVGFGNGDILTDFLYRYDIGIEEANTMHTDIHMDGNDILNTGELDVQTVVNNSGDDVEVNDGFAANQGVRVRNDWVRLHGAIGMVWEDFGGGWYMEDATWIRAFGGRSILTPGTVQAETEVITPRLVDHNDNNFLIDPNGISRVNDIIVTTRSGDVPISAMLPNYVPKRGFIATPGQMVAKPDCPHGGEAKIELMVHRLAWGACTNNPTGATLAICGNVGGGFAMRANDLGLVWNIEIAVANNQVTPMVLAQTYCYYL